MIAALILIAVAGAAPQYDLNAVCKSAEVTALTQDAKVAYDSCLRDEKAARDKLSAHWALYSASARASCGAGESLAPSYVELWTCLEMQPGGSLSLTAVNPNGPDSKLSPGAPPPPGIPSGPVGAIGSGAQPVGGSASPAPSAGNAPSPSVAAPTAIAPPGAAATAPAPGASGAGATLPPAAAAGASPSAPAPGVK